MDDARALAREVRRLALPAILHSLLQTFVFVVDRIMLGRHGEASLAAMQIGGTLEWSIWSVFAAFEVGTIARVGRHVGAGNRGAARRAAGLSLGIAFAFGLLVAIIGLPLLGVLLPLAANGVSASALGEATNYLGVTLPATPFVFLGAAAIASLQAGGDTRTPLAIGVAGNLIHVALNRVLILGLGSVPALGARGAGISTATTFAVEACLAILALQRRGRPVSLRASEGDGPNAVSIRDELRELFHIGGPAFVERIFYHTGYITYALVITRLGDAAMAANQSLISVESICFLSADGFAVAAAALVAQKLGAGKPEEARLAARVAMRDAVLLLTLFGLGAVALRNVILPLFSDDASVLAIGRATIPLLAVAQPFMAIGIVLAQALRGAGQTRQALGISFAGAVFVRLTATWLFTIVAGFGLIGVWLGSTTDWLVRSSVLLFLFRQRSRLFHRQAQPLQR